MAKISSKEVKEIKDDEFDNSVKSGKVVIIDFFAEWCMPCLMMVPVVEELAQNYKNKVKFFKINIDENHEASAKHKILSIPTLLVFKQGNLADRITGALSYDMLKERIDKLV